jgi:CRISPR-associated endonuclease Cas3-HD
MGQLLGSLPGIAFLLLRVRERRGQLLRVRSSTGHIPSSWEKTVDLRGRPLAHSANAAGVTHDLEQHLRDVARWAADFARKFGGADLASWAGLWHDLGKYHPEFQAYLKDPAARRGPDHSSAGAVLAAGHCDALAFLIAGHHAGLQSPDNLKKRLAEKRNAEVTRTAREIAARGLANLTPGERLDARLPEWVCPRHRHDGRRLRNRELFLRMLFSALVDADFLDTERHFRRERATGRGGYPSLAELWRRFKANQRRLTARRARRSSGPATTSTVRACGPRGWSRAGSASPSPPAAGRPAPAWPSPSGTP